MKEKSYVAIFNFFFFSSLYIDGKKNVRAERFDEKHRKQMYMEHFFSFFLPVFERLYGK